jgi:predicted ATP-dependent endonuclease of OLD family
MSTLRKIKIKNYRSIEYLEIDIPQIDDEKYCLGLVGINEAGKSSILKAIALKDNILTLSVKPSDFKNESEPIIIEFRYYLDEITDEMHEILGEGVPVKAISQLKEFSAIYSISTTNLTTIIEQIEFDQSKLPKEIDVETIEKIKSFFKENVHDTVFWTADEKHLINKPIPLSTFINNPEAVSVPLYNCFKLAGIDDIATTISKALGDPTDRDYLEERLGNAVTQHVKDTWRNNLIEIKLKINENLLHFLVKDLASSSKSKTVDQRSDGFKQFISFLLTVSAESKKETLQNTILLIDEPETHLHPIAQGNLLDELMDISKLELNNISFFATHSNYLISKDDLGNYFHVTKNGDNTNIERFNKKQTDYAEVNYLVFNIISTDYHNALYGKLLSELDAEPKDLDQYLKDTLKRKYVEKDYVKLNKDGSANRPIKVSLQTYIRHLIHHPENTNNAPFSNSELQNSIEIMIMVLDAIIQ